jgi:hypothetical protein
MLTTLSLGRSWLSCSLRNSSIANALNLAGYAALSLVPFGRPLISLSGAAPASFSFNHSSANLKVFLVSLLTILGSAAWTPVLTYNMISVRNIDVSNETYCTPESPHFFEVLGDIHGMREPRKWIRPFLWRLA